MLRYLIRIVLEIVYADWQYVGSFDGEKVKMETHDSYANDYIPVKIHLFESKWGTRHAKIKIRRHGFYVLFNWLHWSRVRKSEIWQNQVYPWLRGRRIKDIPTYAKVKGGKWDFKKLLKGETPFVLNDDEA